MKRTTLLAAALMAAAAIILAACHRRPAAGSDDAPLGAVPQFVADSAMAYARAQCGFGPRVMNSEAHERCARWIEAEFRRHGCAVTRQEAVLRGYDGTLLRSANIIATNDTTPRRTRIMLCAHYDSRPWADNDPDSLNWRKPVLAANDGASGIAVMLEVARLLAKADTAAVAVDFVCLDAEDWGTPQWHKGASLVEDPWALGAQHFASEYAAGRYPRRLAWAVLLDMVGGEGATFAIEGMSKELAPQIVDKVWTAAARAGQGAMFPRTDGAMVTDDHIPLNRVAGIPAADVIAYYPNCPQSSFGPTWHTLADTPDHLSAATMQAVGETLIRLIYSE